MSPLPELVADDAPGRLRQTSRVLTGTVEPLTWTCAGPAFEYAIRSALCGALRVAAWPRDGREWAFVRLDADGACAFDLDALADAADVAADQPRSTARRAAKMRRSAGLWADADAAAVTALREGRVRRPIEPRTRSDLVMTANRLRELVFRIWSHHATLAAAAVLAPTDTGSGAARPDLAAALADRFEAVGPISLWGVASAGPSSSSRALGTADPLRPLADSLRVGFGEIRAIGDELARRFTFEGYLDDPADLALLCWDELPDLATSGRIPAEIRSLVAERRARLAIGTGVEP